MSDSFIGYTIFMQVIIRPNPEDVSRLVARLIAKSLRSKPDLVLGLATGSTMERIYAMLAKLHKEQNLDFSLVRTFNLDEYVGLTPDDTHSYHFYMKKHLFSLINVDMRNTHLLDGMAKDFDAECRNYEETIRRCDGIDIQILGLGSVGHIGFNEPLSALYSRTREKGLTPATLAQNARYFDNEVTQMPKRALTMGVGTILEAKRLFMVATGKSKADILSKAVEGPITSMITASAIQLHPHCTVIVDEEAASDLKAQDYYRWIFDNEPEWAEFR
jgi:glucosamine-6-phosphate deaminase